MTANAITKNLFAHVDQQGHRFLLLDDIIDKLIIDAQMKILLKMLKIWLKTGHSHSVERSETACIIYATPAYMVQTA